MGEFLEQEEDYNGHVYFKQRETEVAGGKYLFFKDQSWWVSDTLGGAKGRLRNRQDTGKPPAKGWEHFVGGGKWRDNDPTLKLEFTNLPPPCKLVHVEGAQRWKMLKEASWATI